MRHARQTLLLAALVTAPALGQGTGTIEVGRPFPPILLPDAETGRPTSLADFRGRRLVLHVFASW